MRVMRVWMLRRARGEVGLGLGCPAWRAAGDSAALPALWSACGAPLPLGEPADTRASHACSALRRPAQNMRQPSDTQLLGHGARQAVQPVDVE